jgi:Flp pilus assembly pilin Flp
MRDRGPNAAEFALILALIAIVSIAALVALGGQVDTVLPGVGRSV